MKIKRQINVMEGGTVNEGISTDSKSLLVLPPIDEERIIKLLESIIEPALMPYGDILIQQCKEAIEKIVNQSVIERIKEEVRIEIRKQHFESIQQRMENERNEDAVAQTEFFKKCKSVSEKSKNEAIEKVELIQEWVEEIGNIKKEDKELSDIWEGWFIEMGKDPNIADHKRALEIMKVLSAEEAKLMLCLKKRSKGEYFVGYLRETRFMMFLRLFAPIQDNSEAERTQYFISQLLQNKLITKSNLLFNGTKFMTTSIFLFLCTGVGFALTSVLQEDRKFFFLGFRFGLIGFTIMTTMAVTILLMMLLQKRYRLTWIGEKIVSYATGNKIDSFG